MRQQEQANGLIVQAIAGTYVVMLGWDILDNSIKRNLLGFAIQREDKTEGETIFMRGMKTFPDTSPPLPAGGTASSHEQPFQSFQWADYAAKPGHQYTYTLIPMHGRPGALTDGPSISVSVTTESEWDGTHSVFFNRGAIASQEYARRFQNKRPSEVGEAAYSWLSRGLLEAITTFIGKAKDKSFGLRVAIYEFQWPEVLDAIHDAGQRCADIEVLFDAIPNAKSDPVDPNEEAIATANIKRLCTGITNGKIMHNKFIVLLKNGKPIEVLTGSTNYTENGIFGHLNCAHVVNDPDVAGAYMSYWTELAKDLDLATLRPWNDRNTPEPPNPPAQGTAEVYSPQTGTGTLTRYGEIADSAQHALFMTFAFGMNPVFLSSYEKDDSVLRFALMDKEGSGKGLEKGRDNVAAIRKVPGTVVAVGQNIELNEFDRWLKEISGVQAKENVRWVHTKFMLVDPLSDDPVVITGSANFSAASVETNHENMLVIRGDTRVADIYLSEFMRQFSSYAFRDAAHDATHGKGGKEAKDWKPQDLLTDTSWMDRYTKPGSSGALRRLYFSGQVKAEHVAQARHRVAHH
ncbi:MAG: phospholipase D-like domain-containing protein [Pseudomonadota bacterium]